uniref:Uncharacterized protein n=1 Tax=Acrobeloides nanus TaxID=290746 RepID=A0A914EFS7_9BILA
MLNNRRRSKSLLDRESYGKSFISTKNVATVFNHFALHKLHYQILRTIYADEELALKLHYKSVCPIESRKECKDLMENTIDDNSLDKFTEEIKKRVNNVYKDLNFDE